MANPYRNASTSVIRPRRRSSRGIGRPQHRDTELRALTSTERDLRSTLLDFWDTTTRRQWRTWWTTGDYSKIAAAISAAAADDDLIGRWAAAYLNEYGNAAVVAAAEVMPHLPDDVELPLQLAVAKEEGDTKTETPKASISGTFRAETKDQHEWAQTHPIGWERGRAEAGRQLRRLTPQQQARIRELIASQFARNPTLRDETDRQLRWILADNGHTVGGDIAYAARGLTDQQTSRLIKQARAIADQYPNISADAYRKKLDRLGDKGRRYRAETIARTETIRITNQARLDEWNQVTDAGLLPDQLGKQWVTAVTDVCEECQALSGDVVALDETFGAGYEAPPAHPRCRCTIVLQPLPESKLSLDVTRGFSRQQIAELSGSADDIVAFLTATPGDKTLLAAAYRRSRRRSPQRLPPAPPPPAYQQMAARQLAAQAAQQAAARRRAAAAVKVPNENDILTAVYGPPALPAAAQPLELLAGIPTAPAGPPIPLGSATTRRILRRLDTEQPLTQNQQAFAAYQELHADYAAGQLSWMYGDKIIAQTDELAARMKSLYWKAEKTPLTDADNSKLNELYESLMLLLNDKQPLDDDFFLGVIRGTSVNTNEELIARTRRVLEGEYIPPVPQGATPPGHWFADVVAHAQEHRISYINAQMDVAEVSDAMGTIGVYLRRKWGPDFDIDDHDDIMVYIQSTELEEHIGFLLTKLKNRGSLSAGDLYQLDNAKIELTFLAETLSPLNPDTVRALTKILPDGAPNPLTAGGAVADTVTDSAAPHISMQALDAFHKIGDVVNTWPLESQMSAAQLSRVQTAKFLDRAMQSQRKFQDAGSSNYDSVWEAKLQRQMIQLADNIDGDGDITWGSLAWAEQNYPEFVLPSKLIDESLPVDYDRVIVPATASVVDRVNNMVLLIPDSELATKQRLWRLRDQALQMENEILRLHRKAVMDLDTYHLSGALHDETVDALLYLVRSRQPFDGEDWTLWGQQLEQHDRIWSSDAAFARKYRPDREPSLPGADIGPDSTNPWIKDSEQLGSNPGGFYRNSDNPDERMYVKWAKSDDDIPHLYEELLASKLYDLLSTRNSTVGSAKLFIVNDGKRIGIASPEVKGLEVVGREIADAPGAKEGFLWDAWLANYDVVGDWPPGSNLLRDGAGNAFRLDFGAALRYRGSGAPKPTRINKNSPGQMHFSTAVDELDTLRNPSVNPNAAAVFGDITSNQLAQQLRWFKNNVTNQAIRDAIDQAWSPFGGSLGTGPGGPDIKSLFVNPRPREAEQMFKLLVMRRDALIHRVEAEINTRWAADRGGQTLADALITPANLKPGDRWDDYTQMPGFLNHSDLPPGNHAYRWHGSGYSGVIDQAISQWRTDPDAVVQFTSHAEKMIYDIEQVAAYTKLTGNQNLYRGMSVSGDARDFWEAQAVLPHDAGSGIIEFITPQSFSFSQDFAWGWRRAVRRYGNAQEAIAGGEKHGYRLHITIKGDGPAGRMYIGNTDHTVEREATLPQGAKLRFLEGGRMQAHRHSDGTYSAYRHYLTEFFVPDDQIVEFDNALVVDFTERAGQLALQIDEGSAALSDILDNLPDVEHWTDLHFGLFNEADAKYLPLRNELDELASLIADVADDAPAKTALVEHHSRLSVRLDVIEDFLTDFGLDIAGGDRGLPVIPAGMIVTGTDEAGDYVFTRIADIVAAEKAAQFDAETVVAQSREAFREMTKWSANLRTLQVSTTASVNAAQIILDHAQRQIDTAIDKLGWMQKWWNDEPFGLPPALIYDITHGLAELQSAAINTQRLHRRVTAAKLVQPDAADIPKWEPAYVHTSITQAFSESFELAGQIAQMTANVKTLNVDHHRIIASAPSVLANNDTHLAQVRLWLDWSPQAKALPDAARKNLQTLLADAQDATKKALDELATLQVTATATFEHLIGPLEAGVRVTHPLGPLGQKIDTTTGNITTQADTLGDTIVQLAQGDATPEAVQKIAGLAVDLRVMDDSLDTYKQWIAQQRLQTGDSSELRTLEAAVDAAKVRVSTSLAASQQGQASLNSVIQFEADTIFVTQNLDEGGDTLAVLVQRNQQLAAAADAAEWTEAQTTLLSENAIALSQLHGKLNSTKSIIAKHPADFADSAHEQADKLAGDVLDAINEHTKIAAKAAPFTKTVTPVATVAADIDSVGFALLEDLEASAVAFKDDVEQLVQEADDIIWKMENRGWPYYDEDEIAGMWSEAQDLEGAINKIDGEHTALEAKQPSADWEDNFADPVDRDAWDQAWSDTGDHLAGLGDDIHEAKTKVEEAQSAVENVQEQIPYMEGEWEHWQEYTLETEYGGRFDTIEALVRRHPQYSYLQDLDEFSEWWMENILPSWF